MASSFPSARLGVLGGTGLYQIEGLRNNRSLDIDTPFGDPSGPVTVGELGGTGLAFLARHGPGHRLMPTEINFRANIFALKSLGVEFVLSVSAVGSLREDIHPLDIVVPDQFIDRTRHRPDTFFGQGIVAHVSLADPVCPELAALTIAAVKETGARVHGGGTYLCMEGPQFSTRAESQVYRSLGASVIGMTNMQEARLCREAELCFATLALVTDYDCWKTNEDPVTVEAIAGRLEANAARARQTVSALAGRLPPIRVCSCGRALDGAVITSPGQIPAQRLRQLQPLLRRIKLSPGRD